MRSAPRWEAILLAAGASSRMREPKALLPWSGRRLIEHQILEVLATRVQRVVVVLGAHRERILPRIAGGLATLGGAPAGDPSRVYCVVNPRWSMGKCESIRAGAEAVSPEADHILLAAVDQPLASEVLESLFAVHERSGRLITVPTYRGRRGHPVALRSALVSGLKELSEEREGLRSLVRAAEARGELCLAEVAAPPILWNFNRPEDLPRPVRAREGAKETEVLRWGMKRTSP